MPTVPTYQDTFRPVALEPEFRQMNTTQASGEAFGAGVGRAIAGAGQNIGQVADAMQRLADLKATLAGKDSFTALERAKADLDYGENGYLNTRGRNASEGRNAYVEALEELKKKHAPSDPAALQKYNEAATALVTQSMRTAISHASQGTKEWVADTTAARLSLLRDRALAGYDQPAEVRKSIDLGNAEIDSQAHLMGWGADVVEVKRREFSTGVHAAAAVALAQKPSGARAALDYVRQNAAEMDPATKMEIEKKLKPFAAEEEGLSVVNEIITGGRKASAPTADVSNAGAGPTRAKAHLASISAHKDRPGDTANLDDDFADNLSALIQDAPAHIRDGLGIGSGWRSNERQKELFEKSDKTGKMVAYPAGYEKPDGTIAKGSNHLHGRAADLTYNGARLDKAPAEVREWVHANAGNYGLRFPMSWEAWHIEPIRGGAGSTVTPARDGIAARAAMPSFDAALERINQITDPEVRTAAMRQLTAQFELRSKAENAAADAARAQIWTMMMQDTPLSSIPLDIKIAAGREAMSGFLDYEAKGSAVTTNPAAYSQLSTMAATDPEAFAKVDLTAPEIINNLSREDWKAMESKKSAILTDTRKAKMEGAGLNEAFSQAQAQLRAAGVIKDGILGGTDHKKVAEFQNVLAGELAEFKERHGKNPNQIEVQEIINRMLLPIVLKTPGFWGGEKDGSFLFEAGGRADGQTVSTRFPYTSIPIDYRIRLRDELKTELGRDPSEADISEAYADYLLGR